jgi:hypothetical protein
MTSLTSLRRLPLALVLSATLALGSISLPASASAITRPTVLKRANHWIKKHVRYSQGATYGGYRRDCSGFVSMAWRLKRSYTSSTIHATAKKIARRSLKPGDAVRRPGHVEIFGGWKNKRKRTYLALEESTYGKPALRRVKTFTGECTALRYRHITEAPKHVAKPRPKTPVTPPIVIVPTLPGTDTTGTPPPGMDATGSVVATAALIP